MSKVLVYVNLASNDVDHRVVQEFNEETALSFLKHQHGDCGAEPNIQDARKWVREKNDDEVSYSFRDDFEQFGSHYLVLDI